MWMASSADGWAAKDFARRRSAQRNGTAVNDADADYQVSWANGRSNEMRSFHCLGSSFVAFHLVPLLRGEEETSLLVFFVLAFSSPSSMFSRSQTAAVNPSQWKGPSRRCGKRDWTWRLSCLISRPSTSGNEPFVDAASIMINWLPSRTPSRNFPRNRPAYIHSEYLGRWKTCRKPPSPSKSVQFIFFVLWWKQSNSPTAGSIVPFFFQICEWHFRNKLSSFWKIVEDH